MNKYVKISSPFIFLLSLILILVFKTVPSGKLWKNYTVICVPVNTDDSTVVKAINDCGIKNAVFQSGQYLPIPLAENSVELSMLKLNYNNPEYSYFNKRNAMFFDKANAYRLYYIPSKYNSESSALIRQLKGQGIDCIKDSSAEYPWLLPLIGILLSAMLLIFSKNKIPFLCGSLIPLLYLYGNPFYPVATATCLTMLCIFFISNLWRRKNMIITLLSRYSIPAMLGVAFIAAFSSSLSSGFLFLIAFIGTGSALTACYFVEDYFRNKKAFVPVYIRSSKRVSLFAGKVFTSMNIVTGAALLFIVLIFVTSTDTIKRPSGKILFPAKSHINDSNLPQFEDFYRLYWNVKTYPYKSLNENEGQKDTVVYSSFIENAENGIITEQINTLKYDSSFKKDVYEGIDNLQFDSVEKVMKSEGEDFCGGYTATSSYQINIFGIIMCFICLFILLFIYFSIIIRKGIRK